VLSPIGIGTSLPPHLQASVSLPLGSGGGGHTRLRERGWGSPNSDEGHTLWYYIYLYVLCAVACRPRYKVCKHFCRCLFNLLGCVVNPDSLNLDLGLLLNPCTDLDVIDQMLLVSAEFSVPGTGHWIFLSQFCSSLIYNLKL
jgi:hypothetical protein